MNYAEAYEKWDDLEDCRIRIDTGDGGENMWGKKLENGLIALNNFPLHAEYRYQDVVGSGEAPEVIHRRWKEEIVFNYDPVEDGDESKKLRERIWDMVEGQGGMMSFFVEGVATVLTETPEAMSAITKALEEMDIGFRTQASEDDE